MRSHVGLDAGWVALSEGDWISAKEAFQSTSDGDASAQALDGLGLSLWWLKDVSGAIETRTRAYAAYKKDHRTQEAAMVAVWLARELRTLFNNRAAADGWLNRAETLYGDVSGSPVAGWISLARAEASTAPDAMAGLRSACDTARSHHDSDLEIVSLARMGLVEIAMGDVDMGIAHLDEAMAAASAGEAEDLQSVGDAYCALMDATEMLGRLPSLRGV